MSHIPSSAMPTAGQIDEDYTPEEGGREEGRSGRLGRLADKARSHPKTTIAAGAALVAGVAAAAVPLVRGRGKAASANSKTKSGSTSRTKSKSG